MKRYIYAINEPEDFEKLLKFWSDQKKHYPVFVEWLDIESDTYTVTYWLETEIYRAKVTVRRPTSEEAYDVFSKKCRDNHEFIECLVYTDDEAD